MNLTFYTAPFSSGIPVATALSELEVPHETVAFDLKKSDHKHPDYLALNPNGTVPTLVVDGMPLFESVAILQWLGERYGVERQLWPRVGSADHFAALSWTAWAYASYGAALKRYHLASSEYSPVELHSKATATSAQEHIEGYLRVLDKQLARSQYVLGESFSLVDLVLANTVHYSAISGVPPKDCPKVTAWLAICMQRPSMREQWG